MKKIQKISNSKNSSCQLLYIYIYIYTKPNNNKIKEKLVRR